MDAVTGLFQPIGEQGGAALCGSVFRLSTPIAASGVMHILRFIQRNAAPAGYGGPGREKKLKITEMRIPSKGKLFGQTPLIRVVLSFQRQREVKRCIRGPNPAPS